VIEWLGGPSLKSFRQAGENVRPGRIDSYWRTTLRSKRRQGRNVVVMIYVEVVFEKVSLNCITARAPDRCKTLLLRHNLITFQVGAE
jgi:hypothetical protein